MALAISLRWKADAKKQNANTKLDKNGGAGVACKISP
jgi:hypothetical protein